MRTFRRLVAVVALLTCGGAIVAVMANGLATKGDDEVDRGAAIFSGRSLAETVGALVRKEGKGHLIRQVRVEPGKDPVIVDAKKGDPRAFPVDWVNPLGDRQAVGVVDAWIAPDTFTPTKVILGRRNGRGSLVWRVEGTRAGKAELWLLSPNGTQLSHRRL